MRTLIFLALALTGGLALAGTDKIRVDEPKVPGYYDELGRKQGFFTILGKDRPELNYPAEGKIEEGNFKDDRKTGEWIVYHPDGVTPRLKGNFKDGRPNGPYEKYYANGVPSEKGTFVDGKQRGAFITYYETGIVQQQKVFNEDGKEDGAVVINYPSGEPQLTGQLVNGKKVGEFNAYWEDGSLKERTVYDENGELVSKIEGEPEPQVSKPMVGSGGPSGNEGIMRGKDKFKPDGYNKVYNKAEEIWMDGEFKSGKLWDGKLYKYDSDGILLKIEVWKNGAYHSDGQL